MPLRNSYPIRFTYRGLSDAFDATDAFLGASRDLNNFLFDRDNPEVIVPRPGVTALTSFPGFNTPGFLSHFDTIEPHVFGMISTARNLGFDEPFMYHVGDNLFHAISGVQASNVPASPASSGDWSPPNFCIVGTRLIYAHPGFTGSGGLFFGILDMSGSALAPTGTTAIGSPTITAVSSTVGCAVGQTISGAGIPANSWIVSFTANTITINANATANGAGVALAIAGGTFANPLWGAGNTNGQALPAAPTCVSNFNNRCYYAVGNQLFWSDNLQPAQMSLATQNLTIGDSSPIIALYGSSVQTSSGGVTMVLFIFKKGGQIWQLAGDQATNNLVLAPASLNLGTLAPRSVVLGPEGVYFIGTDGPYTINLQGAVFPVAHRSGDPRSDISSPMRNALTPSRICASFNSQVYRACMDTVVRGTQVFGADYWFDTRKRRWSGIHSFAYDCAAPFDTYFLLSTKNTPGVLFKSQAYPDVNTVYTDNGAAFECVATSSTFPKVNEMREKAVIETITELGLTSIPNVSYSISALDEQGNSLGSIGISTYTPGALWGGFTWGAGEWTSVFSIPHTYDVSWNAPLQFQKIAIQHLVPAAAGIGVGTTYLRYQDLGYTNAQ